MIIFFVFLNNYLYVSVLEKKNKKKKLLTETSNIFA